MKQHVIIGSTRRWRGPGHIRFRKEDLHWLELKKDENGNEISCTSIPYGTKKERMGFCRIRNKGYLIHNEKYLKERSQYMKISVITRLCKNLSLHTCRQM